MNRAEHSFPGSGDEGNRPRWGMSLLIYAAFAAAVFLALGSRPPLGPDHLSYMRLADSIMAACPSGDYWHETNSNRGFSVLLAYLHSWTGSHVLSMKIVLAVVTVLYLLSAELFFALFSERRWQAILFALLSGFALSFGVSSWGLTDTTALLPRTFAAPITMCAMWFWIRHDGRPVKYLVFPFLILGSLLHLSTYYLAGVLAILEAWDFVVRRKCRVDGRLFAFAGALVLAAACQFALESFAVSTQVLGLQIPYLFRSFGIDLPVADAREFLTCSGAAGHAPLTLDGYAPENTGQAFAAGSAAEAWAIELSLRPWRTMPLPLINVVNVFSSSALILLLALWGLARNARAGFSRVDSMMAAMLVAVPLFAFLPQTLLWVLRSFAAVYPATIEEVRALNLVMVPALYFVMQLFRQAVHGSRARQASRAAAIAIAVVSLPLLMKALPLWAREEILAVMTQWRIVDGASASSVLNARSALNLATTTDLYYPTQRLRQWLQANTPPQARILTDRDDMMLLRDRIVIGPRQAVVTAFEPSTEQAQFYLQLASAMQARDTARIRELARARAADFIVVSWRVDGAPYADDAFSVISVRDE